MSSHLIMSVAAGALNLSIPLDGVEASVCRASQGVKQKAVLSRGCAAKGFRQRDPDQGQYVA